MGREMPELAVEQELASITNQKWLSLLMVGPGNQYHQFLNGDSFQAGIRTTQDLEFLNL